MFESIKDAMQYQRDAFRSGQTRNLKDRKSALQRLYNEIQKNEAMIYQALSSDLGKCTFESYTTEIGGVLREIRLAIRHLDSWAKPKKIPTPMHLKPAKSYILTEPYGVVLIIGAFNYPFSLILNPLIGGIAAGNACIVKPAETAPNTAQLIAQLLKDAQIAPHGICVRGDRRMMQELLKERFDHIFFTGSPNVGKVVLRAAAEHLTPVTLELGGKSPGIVTESANPKIAAERVVWGKFLNAGQTCIAPDYILVHRGVAATFLSHVKETIRRFYGDDPSVNKEYGRIVNQKQWKRLKDILDLEKEKIFHGGRIDPSTNYIEPTILYPSNFEDPSMKEELFGPILPIIEYEDLNSQVIQPIQQREKPLALYLFTKDAEEEEIILRELSFGGGAINETMLHYANDNLPFGGVGYSGMGFYHGKHSFDTFSHQKSILKRPSFFSLDLMNPPYRNKLNLIRKLLK